MIKLESRCRNNMLVVGHKGLEQVHIVTVTKLMKQKQQHMALSQVVKAQEDLNREDIKKNPSSDLSNLPNNPVGTKGQANGTSRNSINTIIATDVKNEDMNKTVVNSLENIEVNMEKHRIQVLRH